MARKDGGRRLPKPRTVAIVAIVVLTAMKLWSHQRAGSPVARPKAVERQKRRRMRALVIAGVVVVAVSYWAILQTLEVVSCTEHVQPDSCHLASEFPTYLVALLLTFYALGCWAGGYALWKGATEHHALLGWGVMLLLLGSAVAVHWAVFGHLMAPHTADAEHVVHSVAATVGTWIASAGAGVAVAFIAEILILLAAQIAKVPALIQQGLHRLRARRPSFKIR